MDNPLYNDDVKDLSLFHRVSQDLEDVPIILAGMRNHGKSSSLKTMIKEHIKDHPDWIIKAFDISLNWYHRAPLKHRQLVDKASAKSVKNIGNCVYEMGRLSDKARRTFVATIINNDHLERYDAKVIDPDFEDNYPWVLYIFEEGNTYWTSQSLNKKDWQASTLRDFISSGRNYKQACILVATRVSGEVSPGYRNRCAYMLGRITGKEEKQTIGKATSNKTLALAERLPKYHFIYYNAEVGEPTRIRDVVKMVPQDAFPPITEEKDKPRGGGLGQFIRGFAISLALTLLLGAIIYLLLR